MSPLLFSSAQRPFPSGLSPYRRPVPIMVVVEETPMRYYVGGDADDIAEEIQEGAKG